MTPDQIAAGIKEQVTELLNCTVGRCSDFPDCEAAVELGKRAKAAKDILENGIGVVPVRYTIGEPMKPRPVDWENSP